MLDTVYYHDYVIVGMAFNLTRRTLMSRRTNVDVMLAHRLRRQPNIKQTLGERLVFAILP